MKKLRQIAFYGKGGIGKSTISSNLAAAYAESGHKVMIVGCDPKADCTRNLRGDADIPTVLDVLREKGGAKMELAEIIGGKKIDVDEIVYKGYNGVLCVEAGGPEPAVGCAGRGIIVAIDLLKRLGVYDGDLDLIIYDVLGDVVCGGFGMPLRQGLADNVFIVTSADYLAMYAANNICKGIERHAGRKGSPLGGIVYNVRGAIDDPKLVEEFAGGVGSEVMGAIPNDPLIAASELYGKTVIEYRPDSPIADRFRALGTTIFENGSGVTPQPLSKEKLAELARRIREKTREAADKDGGTAV
jgi:nitrogenase iron protein NifH